MSEKKTEMVTLSIPLREVERIQSIDPKAFGGPSGVPQTILACRAALAARKTKYERWRDGLADIGYRTNGRIAINEEVLAIQGHGTARLMAAAPELLDALIDEVRACGFSMRQAEDTTLEAIRKALPADVAAEVLGE